MKTGWLTHPHCRIYYEVHGSGPALVFAHGLGGNHLSWWQQVAHFSARYSCVVFAHRGFAPSTPVSGATAPDIYADDLAALVAELGLNEFRLVAQSMGGWTSIEYALREPAKVKALVMASTSGTLYFRQLTGAEAPRIREWIVRAPGVIADLESRDILAAHGERMAAEQPAAALLYRQISQLTPADFKAAVRAADHAAARAAAGPARRTADAGAVPYRRGGLPVFRRRRDPVSPALAPRGSAACIPKSGHSVYFERANEFNRIVEEFLA